ncbi:MAG: hypothetical protein IJ746_02865 [Ruminococcus sp.]|nr:hypothetical protein [Ruminococcus sp.]
MGFNTELLQSGVIPDKQNGATLPPVYQVNAYSHASAEELESIFAGKAAGHSGAVRKKHDPRGDIPLMTELAEKNAIASMPTLIVFKDGAEAARLTGFKPKNEIKTAIENVR